MTQPAQDAALSPIVDIQAAKLLNNGRACASHKAGGCRCARRHLAWTPLKLTHG